MAAAVAASAANAAQGDADHPIVVVGAGLAGSLLSLMLAKRGFRVLLLEKRPDFRLAKGQAKGDAEDRQVLGQLGDTTKRSINLALSHRGIESIRAVGIFDKVKDILIPMRGRYMHSRNPAEPVSFQPYGTGNQAIYSVSRADLNRVLLDELESHENAETRFGFSVSRVRGDGTVIGTSNGNRATIPSRLTVGADGAFSSVRQSLVQLASREALNSTVSFISSGYREFSLEPSPEGDFRLQPAQGLHIWPRGEFMFIGLPNPDRSFTMTLFAPWRGPSGLLDAETDDEIRDYFERHFPDIPALMPDFIQQWRSNPASPLPTIRCKPWHYEDKLVLIGDAAHAVVPFYGQGMNCAFEDCLILDELISKHNGNFGAVLAEFSRTRQPSCEGLADLSLANFVEMRHHTASRLFLFKKRVEAVLHKLLGDRWIPLYSMVAFTRLPYNVAKSRGERQDKIINYGGSALIALATCLILRLLLTRILRRQ